MEKQRRAYEDALYALQKYNDEVGALPQDVFDLRELCHELVCLRWVSEYTPELESDRTARRELHARLVIAEQNLHSHLEWVFSPAGWRGESRRSGSSRSARTAPAFSTAFVSSTGRTPRSRKRAAPWPSSSKSG